MNMQEAIEFLGNEGERLSAVGTNKSTILFSTVLQNGDVARMTISVELLENPAIAAKRAQMEQQRQQPSMPPQPGYPQQR